MNYRNEGPFSLEAGEDLIIDRLVKVSSGKAVYCDSGEDPVGITAIAALEGETVSIYPLKGTIETVTCSEAVDQDDPIYAANDGKVTDTAAGKQLGIALEAATANGGKIAALVWNSAAGNTTPAAGSVNNSKVAADAAIVPSKLHANARIQRAMIPVENLAAAGDIAARPIWIAPACGVTLISVGILTQGAPAGVDNSNTVIVEVTDDAANSIVSKTYNTATQPPTSDYESLGALSGTHKVLDAAEHLLLNVTQGGSTADMPAFVVVIEYQPADA